MPLKIKYRRPKMPQGYAERVHRFEGDPAVWLKIPTQRQRKAKPRHRGAGG